MPKERYYEDRKVLFKQLHGRILDIGCNWGEIHNYLEKKQGRIVYGMDIILTNYRDKVAQADAHYIPFKDETFDSVFTGEIIEHLENPAQFLREVERVLKRGGGA
jgi:ubiquinone/menaquinone biosynthesis C-methylase UbiE